MAYILTLDAGTSSVKCTLVDEQLRSVRSAKGEYNTEYPRPGWSQQDPDTIFRATCAAVAALTADIDPSEIAVVGLSGTMNGCIPVDGNGNALHPNIIHSDSRAVDQLDLIRSCITPEDFYILTGNRLDNHFTLPKILWLRERMPEVYKSAKYFLNTKDYLYAHLTGRIGVTDYSDASLTIALDINKGRWAKELLSDLGVDTAKMPEILPGHDISGRITPEAAALTGLKAGTPVAVGGGDGACAARGSGLFQPGSAYSCLGSSSWVSQMTDRPVIDPKARVFNYLDMDGQHNHCCGTIQCGGDALRWGVKNLLGEGVSIEEAETLAMQAKPGAEGVFFLPTLMGERTPYWDPHTRGVLWGFTLYHNRTHVSRALYEGIACALATCAEAMAECGYPARSLMLTGGGAQSRLWPDMLATLIGAETHVLERPDEGTSLGAAIAAGVGAGIFTYEQAASFITYRSTHAPRAEWIDAYAKHFAIYRDIYTQMKPLFDRVAE
ncbi:MAG: hypothetical protein IJJ23_10265 [Clostridia bacterium]|nr:hypothetical protein [Clostridia bacterium]